MTALVIALTAVAAATGGIGLTALNGDVHFVCCFNVVSHLKIIQQDHMRIVTHGGFHILFTSRVARIVHMCMDDLSQLEIKSYW